MRALDMLTDLVRDVRSGWRHLARNPGSVAAVLLVLALGIGANAAVFSLVYGVLLKPLPYAASDRLVVLRETNLSRGWTSFPLSPDDFLDWRNQTRSFDRLAAYQRTSVTRTGTDRPDIVSAYRVTAEYLDMLGADLVLGRGISGDDLKSGADRVVVLENGFWQRSFGGDPEVLGRPLVLDGEVHTIVGVLSAGWRPPDQSATDLILPLSIERHPSRRGGHWLSAVARLKAGVTDAQAQAELATVAATLEAEHPASNKGWGALVVPVDDFLWSAARPQLFLFMGVVIMVLLVACANVATITIGWAAAREPEMAIRVALGAGRWRVARQFLTESLLLSAIGGGLGMAMAPLLLGVLRSAWPGSVPRLDEVHVDGAARLFAGGAIVIAGFTAGLLPALTRRTSALGQVLAGSSRHVIGGRSRPLTRAWLVGGEIAIAVVLLAGSGLLVLSLRALQHVDPGFDVSRRLVFTTPLAPERYRSPGDVRAYASAALERLRTVPGVESVAVTSFVPIRGGVDVRWQVTFEGRPAPDPTELDEVHLYRVSSDYLDAMGIPLVMGRTFTRQDGEGPSRVALVSESFVRAHDPGENPVGKRFRIGGGDPPLTEIIGVVGNVQDQVLGETSRPQVYEPFGQRDREVSALSFVTKTSLPPERLVEALRAEILAVDPDQPLADVQTMEDVLSSELTQPRFRTLLMTGFALMTLLLAVVGVYGVVSFTVSQRAREFGIRMALGAAAPSIVAQVFKDGAPMVVAGIVIGLGGAVALGRVLESMLFGVGPRDVGVLVAVPLGLLTAAGLAMLVPAVRATRLEPARTLVRR